MEKYKIGDYVSGTVTGITNYGIFIKLEEGYTGLIHISEISDKFVSSIEKMYVLDETIDAKPENANNAIDWDINIDKKLMKKRNK